MILVFQGTNFGCVEIRGSRISTLESSIVCDGSSRVLDHTDPLSSGTGDLPRSAADLPGKKVEATVAWHQDYSSVVACVGFRSNV